MNLVQLRTSSTSAPEAPQPLPEAQPVDLVDRSARRVRYVRLSLTDRCNYRCTYCMPTGRITYDPREDLLTLEEIVRLARAFARWGVRRVRLTGGEPTLRRGLLGLVQRLGALPTDDGGRLEVVMTTNAERLAPMAKELRAAGLAAITISLDSLEPERHAAITRRGDLARVHEGIAAAAKAGFAPLRINTVAVRGFNDDELGNIATWAWDFGAVPRFIELMPMAGGDLFVPGTLMPASDVRDVVEQTIGSPMVADDGAGIRGSGPASYWRVTSGRYQGRRLGTIGAMTENFCASCNRLRVSTTGQLHGCLARDDTGDLRGALRSNVPEAIEAVVRQVLGTKRDAHGFNIDGTGGPQKAMISIGG